MVLGMSMCLGISRRFGDNGVLDGVDWIMILYERREKRKKGRLCR